MAISTNIIWKLKIYSFAYNYKTQLEIYLAIYKQKSSDTFEVDSYTRHGHFNSEKKEGDRSR